MKRFGVSTLLAFVLAGFQNCGQAGFSRDEASYGALDRDYGGAPICDPLNNGNGSSNARQGLIGNLYYVPSVKNPTASLIDTSEAFLKNVVQAPGTVFMSQINVPTQSWQTGFKLGDGSLLKDPSNGKPLLEFFGLNMQSVLQLGPNDPEGYYQLATISDDGALLTTGQTVLAGAPGAIHSTRVDCGTTLTPLTRASKLPINYFYFQSPADEVASVVVWRRLPSNAIPDQVGCGLDVPTRFFDPSNADGIVAMQARGWKIVAPANFTLPADAPANACAGR